MLSFSHDDDDLLDALAPIQNTFPTGRLSGLRKKKSSRSSSRRRFGGICAVFYSPILAREFVAKAFACNYYGVITPSCPLSLNHVQLLTSNYTRVSINSGRIKHGFNMCLVWLCCLYICSK